MHKNISTVLLIILLFNIVLYSTTMAENSESSESGVYIVYTEEPSGDADAHHLSTLTSVLGSEEAAKDSLLYTYKTAATGFSAKLTTEQVSELQKKPGVLSISPSKTVQLCGGGGGGGISLM